MCAIVFYQLIKTMNRGICNRTVIPLRAAADHRSEIVNQLFFAEYFEVLAENEEWAQVRMLDHTAYVGWLQKEQFVRIPESVPEPLFQGAYQLVDLQNSTLLPGTKIYKQIPHVITELLSFPKEGSINLRRPNTSDFHSEVQALCAYYKGAPYLWGGRTRYGIDCSGLTQAMYAHFGLLLPRDAYQQATYGELIEDLSQVQQGDLAFFGEEGGRITHVGFILHPNLIFHASGYVRQDPFDKQGIYNEKQEKYTHKLRFVKRLLTFKATDPCQ